LYGLYKILGRLTQAQQGGTNTDNKKRKKRKHANDAAMDEAEDSFEQQMSALQVDPTEPVYCTCRRVSYGQMIACENPDCEVEWYHFHCVGIKSEVRLNTKTSTTVCFTILSCAAEGPMVLCNLLGVAWTDVVLLAFNWCGLLREFDRKNLEIMDVTKPPTLLNIHSNINITT
jgi:hypothetical protein